MTKVVNIAIAGALGRMGQAVAATAEGSQTTRVVARFDRADAASEGLIDRETALTVAAVVIDFTTGAASVELAETCAALAQQKGRSPALVIGSTGFTDGELERLQAAARKVAILRSGNFSLGVNMLMGLVAQAARALPANDWDIEVFEAHHRRKIDAPSGTALMLGEAAAQGRGIDLAVHAERVRDGVTGPRAPGAIGFSVQRGGGIIGEHSVSFVGESEILTLSHSALDRGLFARGALAAAAWVAGKPPGVYDMQDVLGLKASTPSAG